jgi:DNA recombination protein RmuC
MVLVILSLVILALAAAVVVLLLGRPTGTSAPFDASPILGKLELLEKAQERAERTAGESFDRIRRDVSEQGKSLRDEVQNTLKGSTDSLVKSVEAISEAQQKRLEDFISRMDALKSEQAAHAKQLREELQGNLKASTEALIQAVDKISSTQHLRLEDFAKRLEALKQGSEASSSQLRTELGTSLTAFKESQNTRLGEIATQLERQLENFGRRLAEFGQTGSENAAKGRAEQSKAIKDFGDSLQRQFTDAALAQKQQLELFAGQLVRLIESNEKKATELRQAIEVKLDHLASENVKKLEEMRATVDEKLQSTLEKRLGESFKLVGDRLDLVHKGLGEMQTLATGVGDLKRVLTNVKTRGGWGEMQLGRLLDELLHTGQYAKNVQTVPGSKRELVEYAIKLPGKKDDEDAKIWLPIDAKFPKEDYERLVDAAEKGDLEGVEAAGKALELRIRAQARDIRDKYVEPPYTTDFGMLYLPTEGLYAEVLRRPGLADSLQREYRVIVVGPTTIAAFLNSLQMGFTTLAVQKRSSEVWKVLGAVKTDFAKFGDLLDGIKKKLDDTGSIIEKAAHRGRQIQRKLRTAPDIPEAEATALLHDGAPEIEAESEAGSGDPD